MTESLPADIPTVQEIVASKHILSQHNSFPQKVVRVRNYAIKIHCAKSSFENEPENLRFLSQYPGLKVPKFYIAFEDSSFWPFDNCTRTRWGPNLKVYYLILDFIPGDTLEHRWSNLSPEQRTVVQQKLREQLQILRSIRLSEPYFGQFGNRPYPCGTIASKPDFGPYTNDEDLIRDITNSLNMDIVRDKEKYEVEFAAKILRESSLFRGSLPTITIGDFQDKNTMITLVGKSKDGVEYDLVGDEDIIVTLIDWELLVWAPERFQYCDHLYLGEPSWWGNLLMETLEPWYAQLSWWHIIRRALR